MIVTALWAALWLWIAPSARALVPDEGQSRIQVATFTYVDYRGEVRPAYVLLPASYDRSKRPPLPLVISPHGRGVTGAANARLWGELPGQGFAVVCPDSFLFSWGAPGQIEDLARMPELIRKKLPWLRVDPRRVYAAGGSMGGHETLLLVAKHPRLLAGAISDDGVADFARQYYNFGRLPGRYAAGGRLAQKLARKLLGGTPAQVPAEYAARSPLTYAKQIADSCVPLHLWWSHVDQRILESDARQSGRLFKVLRKINPQASVDAYTGDWPHTRVFKSFTMLPYMAATLGLIPDGGPLPPDIVHVPARGRCVRSAAL